MASTQGHRRQPVSTSPRVVASTHLHSADQSLVINRVCAGSRSPQPSHYGQRLEDRQDPAAVRQKTQNMALIIVGVSLVMVAYCVFDDCYNQWLYVRFEQDVMGDSFSHINFSTSTNPCLRGNISTTLTRQLNEAQTRASEFLSWSMLAALGPALFANIVLGAYSDRIGRKVFLVVPISGYLIRQCFTCAVAHWELDMRLLYIGLLAEGFTGSFVAIFVGIYIYTSDNTTQSKSRSFGMVLVQTVSAVLYALTHLAEGYFITYEGYLWPLVTSSCLTFAVLLWCLLVIPETWKRPERVRTFKEGLKSVFSFYFTRCDNPKYKRRDFILLMAVFFIWGITVGAQFQTLFLMNQPFCWSAKKIAYIATYKGVVQGLGSLVGMPVLQLFLADEVICVVGLVSGAASRVILAFATNDWFVYLGFGFGIFETLVLPVIRAIVSRMVHFQQRGSVFASMGVLEVTTVALSGVGVNYLYSDTVTLWPGLAYICVAGCVLVAGILMAGHAIVYHRREKKRFSFFVQDVDEGSIQDVNSVDDDDKPLLP